MIYKYDPKFLENPFLISYFKLSKLLSKLMSLLTFFPLTVQLYSKKLKNDVKNIYVSIYLIRMLPYYNLTASIVSSHETYTTHLLRHQ